MYTTNTTVKTALILLLALLSTSIVLANPVTIVDSQEWTDVYSVLLYSALNEDNALFVNSRTFSSVTRQIPPNAEITLYSGSNPYISTLGSQLRGANINVVEESQSNSLNTDLAQGNRFIVVSQDSARTALGLASYAKQENKWVFIVNQDNVNEVVNQLQNAQDVLAVGTFRRDVWQNIESFVTDRINEGDTFADNRVIASRMNNKDNVVITDGSIIEAELFTTNNPILLTGRNRITDDNFAFLTQNNVRTTILVGNELSVVGEQIRDRSDRSISVFIKFGQSVVGRDGGIYSLTTFAMPQATRILNVEQAIYDPASEELAVYFVNEGNAALYMLSTISVKTGDDERELGSVADNEPLFLGAGETLPVIYDVSLSATDFDESTFAEFFTSFGASPSELDTFLTMRDLFSPPFRIPVTLGDFGDALEAIEIVDAAYFSGMNRVGVTINNPNNELVHVRVQVNDLIVSGLEETLLRTGRVAPLSETIIYLPVELDRVDLEENVVLDIEVSYGSDENFLVRKVTNTLAFRVEGGFINLLTGMVTGIAGSGNAVLLLLLVAALGGAFFYLRSRGKKE